MPLIDVLLLKLLIPFIISHQISKILFKFDFKIVYTFNKDQFTNLKQPIDSFSHWVFTKYLANAKCNVHLRNKAKIESPLGRGGGGARALKIVTSNFPLLLSTAGTPIRILNFLKPQ